MRKYLINVPGTGYTTKETLFQKLIAMFVKHGYQSLEIDFSMIDFKVLASVEESISTAQAELTRQLLDLQLAQDDDIVFLSKSLGTACSVNWCLENHFKANHIFLTPIRPTLEKIPNLQSVLAMVVGSKDQTIPFEEVLSVGKTYDIPTLLIEGVPHHLKSEHLTETEKINHQIEAFVREVVV